MGVHLQANTAFPEQTWHFNSHQCPQSSDLAQALFSPYFAFFPLLLLLLHLSRPNAALFFFVFAHFHLHSFSYNTLLFGSYLAFEITAASYCHVLCCVPAAPELALRIPPTRLAVHCPSIPPLPFMAATRRVPANLSADAVAWVRGNNNGSSANGHLATSVPFRG